MVATIVERAKCLSTVRQRRSAAAFGSSPATPLQLEDGKILQGQNFNIVPELHAHPGSSDAWETYAKKLTREIGKIVQKDVQALMKKCGGSSRPGADWCRPRATQALRHGARLT